jgi:hypothetical protein
MQMSLGYTVPFLLRTAAQLCLADHLADGARTAEQLATATHTHAPSLYRLLRTLASVGLFSEDAAHRFSLTPLAQPLRSNVPGSVRTSILSITGELFIIPWSKLLYSVQTGRSAFDEHFGVPFFDHLTSNPEEAAMFSDLLIGLNRADPPAVAAAYDFSSFSHIADIGGGTGHLLATVLASHSGPRGTLVDLPHSQAGAEALIASRGMTDRIVFTAGSFFEAVPAGCDLYMLSHIIHDWSEAQCLTILGNCHRAMSRTSRLLIIEMVLSEGNAFHPGKMLDMTMLATTPGQERTEPEYRALLAKAGFTLTRVIPTDAAVSVVEAVPV